MADSKEQGITDELGKTPLHLAADSNELDNLETLLNSGKYDVNVKDFHGETALHHLVNGDTFDELYNIKRGIQLLLDSGSDINIQNKLGETPLHCVFNNYDRFTPDIIRYLLENSQLQYNHYLKDDVGYTVFYKFMVDFRQSLQERDDFGEIVEETEKMIKDFLDGKFAPLSVIKDLLNDKDKIGCSVFHVYTNVVEYRLETIKRMIDCGADVNTASNVGVTPLMDAIYVRETPIVEVLLETGANPNHSDIFGQSSIFRVFTIQDFELLCKHGVDLSIKDKFGRTPLYEMFLYTSEKSPKSGITLSETVSTHRPLAEILIERGLNPNERDRNNSTPLHCAAWYGHPEMTSILLQNGADPNIMDQNGLTPYDIAFRFENYDICSLLKSNQESLKKGVDDVTKYSNVYISFKDIENMDSLLRDALEFNDDPVELVNEALQSKKVGLVEKQENSEEVMSDVVNFMKIIADKITTTHPLFRCSIYHVGSSADGSKIGDPDELDFMFCLDYFSEECVPHQSTGTVNSGFAMLKVKSFDGNHPLAPFISEDHSIESYLVRDVFKDLFTEAVNSPDVWERSPSLYFDGLMEFKNEKPNINMHIDYFGSVMKNITLRLDIVPAVIFPQWIPIEMENMSVKRPSGLKEHKENYVLLFQPPEELDSDHRKLLRISASLCELSFMRRLPSPYKESYAAAKILVSEYFCPKIQVHEDIDVESIFREAQDNSKGKKLEGNGNVGIDDDGDDDDEEEEMEDDNDGDDDDSAKSDGENYSETIVLSDNDSTLKGAILVKNGEINSLSSWIIEIESGIVNKLFTPSRGQVTGTPKVSVLLEEDACKLETKSQLLTFHKGNKTWHWWRPYHPEMKTMDEDEDDEDEEEDMTVGEWITKNIKKRLTSEYKSIAMGISGEENQKAESSKSVEKGELSKSVEKCESNKSVEKGESSKSMEKDMDVCAGTMKQDPGSTMDIAYEENEENKVNSGKDNRETGDDNIQWEGGEIVRASEELSSYMLKNCLFEVASDLSFSEDVQSIDLVLRIFEKLEVHAQSRKLSIYFLPFLDIFSFSKAHIHMISEENMMEEIEEQCKRIQWFCQIILSILRQEKISEPENQ